VTAAGVTGLQQSHSKRWRMAPLDTAAIDRLAHLAVVPKLIAQLLLARGVTTAEEARRFFHPQAEHLHDPFRMLGMDRAVIRLQSAIQNGETVLIYGDYDVDGTTATVLLKTAIEILGGKVRYHIPHRTREGYGMQPEVLEQAAAEGVSLVVSVDTGIRAHAVSEVAATLGLDLIVTDHHIPDGSAGVPRAIAVLNPNQAGCSYPNKHLCGAGVAFKLAQALLEASDRERAQKKLLPSFLKIVAIATIADAVPLLGENRALVSLGLKELHKPIRGQNPGLRALLHYAGLDLQRGQFTATDVAFRVAPRINAAGRMEIASDVVELLTTRDATLAEALAEKLDRLNGDRKLAEQKVLAEADARMAADATLHDAACLVVDGQGWHRGVLGIVASRLVDRWHRPVLVMATENGEAHGSGRSIRSFHLLDALTSCGDVFTRFGGHAHAVGFSLPAARVEELRQRLTHYAAARLTDDDRLPELECAAELPLDRINPELMKWLDRLEPLGMENPEPLFIARGVRVCTEPRAMKERHVRLRLAQGDAPGGWKAVGWNLAMTAESLGLAAGQRLDIVYRLRENDHPEFGGLELELADLRLSVDES
jgi:single-stranded-DNA-specific exonuclease